MTHILKRSLAIAMSLALVAGFLAIKPASAQETETINRIELTAQLIELSSTEAPTTIIVRQNPEGEFTDFTVEISETTVIRGPQMDDWITGDLLNISGFQSENTLIVDASIISNLSINQREQHGLNGWITDIDLSPETGPTMTVQWNGVEHVVTITDDTRMVVPPINPAGLQDFQIGDRVRLRLEEDNKAKIIVALRRGDEIFLKARTRVFGAILEEINLDDRYMSVYLHRNDHLKADDVNNLVGVENELVTVTWDENTRFVQAHEGISKPEDFLGGHWLTIVGRVDDDGVINARLVRNNSSEIEKRPVKRARISSIDSVENVIEAKLLPSRISVTITYGDNTPVYINGLLKNDWDLSRGDVIRFYDSRPDKSDTNFAVSRIDAQTLLYKPVRRIRPLSEIIRNRNRSAAGLVDAEEIVENQVPRSTGETLSDDEIRELESESEDDLDDSNEERDHESDDDSDDDSL